MERLASPCIERFGRHSNYISFNIIIHHRRQVGERDRERERGKQSGYLHNHSFCSVRLLCTCIIS